MAHVITYSVTVRPYCVAAERLPKQRGVEQIEKVLIDREPGEREKVMTRTNRRTVPQIYINERHIGGFDDLSALDREGSLVLPLAARFGGLRITQKCPA